MQEAENQIASNAAEQQQQPQQQAPQAMPSALHTPPQSPGSPIQLSAVADSQQPMDVEQWNQQDGLKKDPDGKTELCIIYLFEQEMFLTHYHTIPHFDTLKICSCGKHCEKRRNCL